LAEAQRKRELEAQAQKQRDLEIAKQRELESQKLAEAQKIKECLSAQLADAKYEALKSQQYLGDKIDECCCSVKEKMDVIDRDRLRDNLTVEREENNVLKILELGQFYGRGRDDRGDRGRGRR
jgi:hypothetical protein